MMRLTHFTLVDKTLDHQVVFLRMGGSASVYVSCNCLEYKKPSSSGSNSHLYMGTSGSLDEARELYNNPDNHNKTFSEEDRAKW